MHPPYNIEEEDGIYKFTTDNSIEYNIVFTETDLFQNNGDVSIYDFSFGPVDVGYTALPAQDHRIFPTVKSIIEEFFQQYTNAMLFVCDSSDKRARARKILFERWHKTSSCKFIEKHDEVVKDDELEIEYYTSVLIHESAPQKEDIINEYKDLGIFYSSQKD